jgi:hypothetical protein
MSKNKTEQLLQAAKKRVVELEADNKLLRETNRKDIESFAHERNEHAHKMDAAITRIAQLKNAGSSWMQLIQDLRIAYLVKFSLNEIHVGTDRNENIEKEKAHQRRCLHAVISASPYDPTLDDQEIDGKRMRWNTEEVCAMRPPHSHAFDPFPEQPTKAEPPFYPGSSLHR